MRCTGTILLAMAMLAGAASAAEFSADVELKEPSGVVKWKLHVKGRVHRLEGEEKGKRQIVIVDRAADTATVIDPQAKTYEVIKAMKIAWVDPFYRSMVMKGSMTKAEGDAEELDGRSCKRFTYTHPAQKGLSVEVWHATDLDHMVKQVITQGKRKAELILTNIQVGPVAVDLVKVPEGLERKKTPEEIEAALPSLSEAVDAEVPVGRRLSGGGELRVKIDPKRKVEIFVESRTKDETVVALVPCHGGKPRQNIGSDPWTLKYKGDRRRRKFNDNVKMFGDAFQVDEVRIKVSKGLCRARVEQSDESGKDMYVFGGASCGGQAKPTGLTLTVTGDYQAGPTSTGTLILNVKGKRQTEEFTLENGKSKTWTFDADQGVENYGVKILLGKGGVKVRAK
ncbi:MAG: hypothetical protein ACYTG3_18795 [Planctomycetota bacterium]